MAIDSNDVTNLIQRVEPFEERLGLTFEGLYAAFDAAETLSVNGELHVREGSTLEQDIVLHVSVLDSDGRVLDTTNTDILAEKFYGFETFSLPLFDDPISDLSTIRIYPQIK